MVLFTKLVMRLIANSASTSKTLALSCTILYMPQCNLRITLSRVRSAHSSCGLWFLKNMMHHLILRCSSSNKHSIRLYQRPGSKMTKEEDVGIVAFVNSDNPGFTAVLKQRFVPTCVLSFRASLFFCKGCI